jgi:hypothetical protein
MRQRLRMELRDATRLQRVAEWTLKCCRRTWQRDRQQGTAGSPPAHQIAFPYARQPRFIPRRPAALTQHHICSVTSVTRARRGPSIKLW